MTRTLDKKLIQYMNLFEKNTGVRAIHCFNYNSSLIFVIHPKYLTKAIGENGANVRKLCSMVRKKIKIVAEPEGINSLEEFVSAIVFPIQIKKIEIIGDEVVISASPQYKAALIGKGKFRFEELQKIIYEYFNFKKLKIV